MKKKRVITKGRTPNGTTKKTPLIQKAGSTTKIRRKETTTQRRVTATTTLTAPGATIVSPKRTIARS